MRRLLIAPLLAAAPLLVASGEMLAQAPFPAPLPGQAGQPPTSSLPSYGAPQTGTAAPQSAPREECSNGFAPLREIAERESKSVKAAYDRRAPAEEACKLIGNFRAAEAKLVKYLETNAARCGVPAQVVEQLRQGHKDTGAMQIKVCTLAQQVLPRDKLQSPTFGPAGPTGDFWPTSPGRTY